VPKICKKRQITVDSQLARQLTFSLSKGLNQFNHDLFPKLAALNDGNIVISPFSLHTALSMTLIGTPTKSDTHKQLSRALFGEDQFDNEAAKTRLVNYLKVINFYENAGNDVKIKLGNKAFAYEGLNIKADYINVLTQLFKSGLERVNFANSIETANKINNYVDDVTDGLIDEIVQPSNFDADTRMLLINAIYFKANWLTKFNERDTKPMKFQVTNDIQVDYDHGMNMREDLFHADMADSGFNAQIPELPYENENFRMLLILPNEGINIGELNLQKLNYDILNTKLVQRKIQLRLPRFKMEFEAKMRPFLEEVGISDLFEKSKADLSDIADEPLYVSDVTHKSVIEVNEEGSEAAGVSAVQINTRTSVIQRFRPMIFDKPFYFIIQDKLHNLNLFMGRIVDPSGVNGLGNTSEDIVLTQPLSSVVRQSEQAQTPNCDELGYQTQGDSNGGVILPCTGESTLPLRGQEGFDSETKQEEIKEFQ